VALGVSLVLSSRLSSTGVQELNPFGGLVFGIQASQSSTPSGVWLSALDAFIRCDLLPSVSEK